MIYIKAYDQFRILESFELIQDRRLGSNPGGMYKNTQTGETYYIKFPQLDSDQANIEVLSSEILALMGIQNLNPEVVEILGQKGVATKWLDSLSTMTNRDLSGLTQNQANDIGKLFAHAILVKNWDVVGNGVDSGKGNIYKIGNEICAGDTGGSFYFRAQGRRKDYTSDVSELETLLDIDRNYESSRFLTTVFNKYPNSLTEGKKAVQNLNMSEVKTLFDESNLDDSSELFSTFQNRRSLFLKQIDRLINEFDQK